MVWLMGVGFQYKVIVNLCHHDCTLKYCLCMILDNNHMDSTILTLVEFKTTAVVL